MAWVLKDRDDRAILKEIAGQSDRGAILIATAFLERRSEQAIRLFIDPDPDPDTFGKLFKGNGPLASFSAKIDIGQLLQLYPEEVHKLLHKLREIRNDAAHELTSISFELPTIKDRCSHMHELIMPAVEASDDHYLGWIRVRRYIPRPEMKAEVDDGFGAPTFSLDVTKKTPRDTFFAIVKYLLFQLWRMQQMIPPAVRIELPPPRGKSARPRLSPSPYPNSEDHKGS